MEEDDDGVSFENQIREEKISEQVQLEREVAQ